LLPHLGLRLWSRCPLSSHTAKLINKSKMWVFDFK
jgi:hypothetical protein